MHLKMTRDIDSEKLWMSKEINHGDWPFRFAIRLEYTEDWGDNAVADLGKYHLSLLSVSPEAAKQTDAFDSALRSCGFTREQIKEWGPYAAYEVLIDYGAYATLWQDSGNNLAKLQRKARLELAACDMLFGFAMDKPQNAIGSTGWDFIKGDILGGLKNHT